MPAIVSFNVTGPGLYIEEIDTGGDNELDLAEIYSEWKDWAATSDNLKYPPAFRQVGSDPITEIQNLGTTFFLNTEDGWQIRPAERDHLLQINGNLFTDPAGENPIAPTVGAYTVLVRMFVSNLVDASVARLDLTQLNPAVFIDTLSGVSGTDEGVGTPTNPVNNIADAFTIATRDKLREFRFRGSLTLDRDATGWTWHGQTASTEATLNISGYDVDGSRFEHCTLTGTMQGRIEAVETKLDIIDGVDGVFRRCGVVSSVSTANGATVVLQDCISEVPGTATPSLDVGTNSSVSVRNYSGGLELLNVTSGTTCSIDMDPGRLVLGATNTGGVVVCRGISQISDNSAGTTVVSDGLIESEKLTAIYQLLGLDSTKTLTITSPTPGGASGSQTVGTITLQVSETVGGTVTVTRTS